VRWRIEQADAFREQVEHDTDAERVIPGRRLPGAAALRTTAPSVLPAGDPPVPRSAGRDADALVLPTVVVGYQVLGDAIVVQAADIIRRQ
jgi:hypothetical protein